VLPNFFSTYPFLVRRVTNLPPSPVLPSLPDGCLLSSRGMFSFLLLSALTILSGGCPVPPAESLSPLIRLFFFRPKTDSSQEIFPSSDIHSARATLVCLFSFLGASTLGSSNFVYYSGLTATSLLVEGGPRHSLPNTLFGLAISVFPPPRPPLASVFLSDLPIRAFSEYWRPWRIGNRCKMQGVSNVTVGPLPPPLTTISR